MAEFPLFQSMLSKQLPPGQSRGFQTGMPILPMQISFELHYWNIIHTRLTGEVALLWDRLYEAGYRVVSREDNPLSQYCSEFTIVRTVC